jgi:hypothetical protein
MKEFTIYKHPKKDRYEAIKIGFAWSPFLGCFVVFPLGLAWLWERKLFLISIPYWMSFFFLFTFAKHIKIYVNETGSQVGLIVLLIHLSSWLLVGFKGNGWSHKKLKKKGYPIIKTVKARTRKSAIALAKNLKKEDKEEEYQEVISGNKECPMCAETVKARAKICRFCNYEFE